MPLHRLLDFLDSNRARYVKISHSPAYTAQEIASCAHIPGQELAKTVIVLLDGTLVMAVLPASASVHLAQLKEATGAREATLATEEQFEAAFPDCEVGAMPPFGNLYQIPVYVDLALTRDEKIAFNAGTHTELLQMDYADFERLVEPTIVSLSYATAGIQT